MTKDALGKPVATKTLFLAFYVFFLLMLCFTAELHTIAHTKEFVAIASLSRSSEGSAGMTTL